MGQFRMTRNTAQSFAADVAFANVPMTIDPRIVRRARIVEMNGTHVSQSNRAANCFQRRFQSICFANVVTGGERMRRINAHAEGKFRAGIHDRAQMFKTMPDALALAGGVFQQNSQPAKLQPFYRYLQTARTGFYSIL